MNVLVALLIFDFITFIQNLSTNKRIIDDEYYLNYDYETANNSKKVNTLILPNPQTIDSKYTVDVLPNIELPDDSLADTDLKDHDFIDNLMYVYYGSHNRNAVNYGSEVIIIGSVLSCAAQLLTIFCVLLKKNSSTAKKEMKNMFLHLISNLCFSNLLFMLGVYASRNSTKCLIIALILHYLHLLTAFWMFLYCYYIYQRLSNGLQKINFYFMVGYGLPLIFSITTFLLSPHSFETKRFCFMSVQKGMIINYMFPVSILIVITTVYSLSGIRKLNIELSKLEFSSSAESLNALKNELEFFSNKTQECDVEEVVSLRDCKSCLKLLCGIQTGYDIVWFIVVLALENNTDNNSMSIVYSITSCFLNWYIFIKAKSFLPSISCISETLDKIIVNNGQEKIRSNTENCPSRRSSSDSTPLLVNSENCTEMRELRLDHISTISN